MSDLENNNFESPFEKIKKISKKGTEYWYARELMVELEYQSYRNFLPVIKKAIKSCENSHENESDHFAQVHKMVAIGSNSKRKVEDYCLTRYACYLIVQNSDPSKKSVALGQTYFAIQTRKQEITDKQRDETRRLALRHEVKKHNKNLATAANNAGVKTKIEYAIFQNHGYKGLYNEMDCKEIKNYKKLKKSEQLLDHMGSTELAANLFRATQAEEKLKRENIINKNDANKAHYHVGKKVRQTIEDLGGTMPEDLPVEEDIRKLERKYKDISSIKENDEQNKFPEK
ncbi:DNA damage-inducible protein D [Clostridium sp. BJN0013]|jgi:DNA-damage-inducible protein D|uniref:DNA damage-inducible protein D n=1 Tax=Clostridium sp. BJN0013 TaxID=3236840 RepID=UPI0034C6DC94